MADIPTTFWSQVAAANISPAPDGWPPNSLPTIVYQSDREMMGAIKREWARNNPTVTSTGSANAQVLTYTVPPVAYIRGMRYSFVAGFTNTGATTLQVNTLAALPIYRSGQPLLGGEIVVNQITELFYDGTQFQLPRLVASAGTGNVRSLIDAGAVPGTGTDNNSVIAAALSEGGIWTGEGLTYGISGSCVPVVPAGTSLTLMDTTLAQLTPQIANMRTLTLNNIRGLNLTSCKVLTALPNINATTYGSGSGTIGINLVGCQDIFINRLDATGDGKCVGVRLLTCSNFTIIEPQCHDMEWSDSSSLVSQQIAGMIVNSCQHGSIYSPRMYNLTSNIVGDPNFPAGSQPFNTNGLSISASYDVTIYDAFFSNLDQGIDVSGVNPSIAQDIKLIGGVGENCYSWPVTFKHGERGCGVYNFTSRDCGRAGFAIAKSSDEHPFSVDIVDCQAHNSGSLTRIDGQPITTSTSGVVLTAPGFSPASERTTVRNFKAYAGKDDHLYRPNTSIRPGNYTNYYVGPVSSVTVNFGGVNYSGSPTIILPLPDIPLGLGGVQATAHAVVSGGAIQSIVLDNAGDGYNSETGFVIITDSTGAGADAVIVLPDGNAYKAALNDWTATTSYTANDVVSFRACYYRAVSDHTSGSFFKVDFAAGLWTRWVKTSSTDIQSGQPNWQNNAPTWTTGTQEDSAGIPWTYAGYGVDHYNIVAAGSGLSDITLTVAAPDLPGTWPTATAHANLDGGAVLAVAVDIPGEGYSVAPVVTPTTSGGGVLPTITASLYTSSARTARKMAYWINGGQQVTAGDIRVIDPDGRGETISQFNGMGVNGTAAGVWRSAVTSSPKNHYILQGTSGTVTDISVGIPTFNRDLTVSGLLYYPRQPLTLSAGANNNVAMPIGSMVTVTASGDFSITGMVAGGQDQWFQLVNTASTHVLTIAHQSASSTVGNRIMCPGATDLVITNKRAVITFSYLGVFSVWAVTAYQTY